MDCDRAFRLLKLAKLPQGLQLVKASWLSSCIEAQQIVDTAGYSLFIPENQSQFLDEKKIHPQLERAVTELKGEPQAGASSPCTATNSSGLQEIKGVGLASEEPAVTLRELEALRSGRDLNALSEESSAVLPTGNWVCAQSSENKRNNLNQCITEKLELLAKAYSVQGDKWRALGYSRAINALKSYHKPVTSYQVNGRISSQPELLSVTEFGEITSSVLEKELY
uniref:BRCT domain-containing protein n=1 Tax=Varanus komodoensis TaxID=61221 RepID=A0A8D2LGN6_VARKO